MEREQTDPRVFTETAQFRYKELWQVSQDHHLPRQSSESSKLVSFLLRRWADTMVFLLIEDWAHSVLDAS